MQSPIVILTGASGVGKTSIAQAVENEFPEIMVYQGDLIGLPSEEIMTSFGPVEGPGGASQRGFALHWIGEIAATLSTGPPVLLEAQCRVAFLQEALQRHRVAHARVILVECDDDSRSARLMHDRQQPNLANEDIRNWSRFLHQEALSAGYEFLTRPLCRWPGVCFTLLRICENESRCQKHRPSCYAITDASPLSCQERSVKRLSE